MPPVETALFECRIVSSGLPAAQPVAALVSRARQTRMLSVGAPEPYNAVGFVAVGFVSGHSRWQRLPSRLLTDVRREPQIREHSHSDRWRNARPDPQSNSTPQSNSIPCRRRRAAVINARRIAADHMRSNCQIERNSNAHVVLNTHPNANTK